VIVKGENLVHRHLPASSHPQRTPHPTTILVCAFPGSCLPVPVAAWCFPTTMLLPGFLIIRLSTTIRLPTPSRYFCPADCLPASGSAAQTTTHSAFPLLVPLLLYRLPPCSIHLFPFPTSPVRVPRGPQALCPHFPCHWTVIPLCV